MSTNQATDTPPAAPAVAGPVVERVVRPLRTGLPTREKPVSSLTMLEAANLACEALPDGYVLSLHMEHGSVGLELRDPDGKVLELPDAADEPLAMQIKLALFYACGW